MSKKKKLVLFLFLLIFVVNSFSQIAVGQWRDHLPFSNAMQVVEGGNNIYCLTSGGVFYFNKSDNSINKLTKVTGMSDVDMSSMQYSEQYGLLLVGYSDGNIDIINSSGITNISDITRFQITGSKSVNSILFIGNYAYLSCGFGIVVVDIVKFEIKSSYFIGINGSYLNINQIAFDGTTLFAATDKGIYTANINNPNLENYQNWSVVSNIPDNNQRYNAIVYYNNRVITNFYSGVWDQDTLYSLENGKWVKFDSTATNRSNTINLVSYKNKLFDIKTYYLNIYNMADNSKNTLYSYINNEYSNPICAITDRENQIWVADYFYGLVKFTGFYSQSIIPTGPASKNAAYMDSQGDKLIVVPGGKNLSWNRLGNTGAIYEFVNDNWINYTSDNIPQFDTIYDFAEIRINPYNYNQIMIGSWGSGVIEFDNNQLTNVYDNRNSTIQNALSSGPYIRVGGVAFDSDNNLWATNSEVQNSISVRKPDGTWVGLNYQNDINALNIGDIIVTSDNNKWVILPNGGLFVFNTGSTFENTSDDLKRKFDIVDENGTLISDNVFSIAQDQNGAVWVGTDQGVVVYYDPADVFTSPVYSAQQIKIPSDIPGQASYLLGNEVVTCIAIDGADRKWFGTDDAGVFLMSEDCTTQILNFNVNNSPLLSNNIMSLAIDNSTGEVFFGTSEGIVSYKGTATKGNTGYDSVYVYPNPVKRNYSGQITVKGLVANSNVKITDISGNIVYEAVATGGQAVWNGKNFSGQKIHTGVYLVFCSNEDGSKSHVTKLLVMD